MRYSPSKLYLTLAAIGYNQEFASTCNSLLNKTILYTQIHPYPLLIFWKYFFEIHTVCSPTIKTPCQILAFSMVYLCCVYRICILPALFFGSTFQSSLAFLHEAVGGLTFGLQQQKLTPSEVSHSLWKMVVGRQAFPFGKTHFQGLC